MIDEKILLEKRQILKNNRKLSNSLNSYVFLGEDNVWGGTCSAICYAAFSYSRPKYIIDDVARHMEKDKKSPVYKSQRGMVYSWLRYGPFAKVFVKKSLDGVLDTGAEIDLTKVSKHQAFAALVGLRQVVEGWNYKTYQYLRDKGVKRKVAVLLAHLFYISEDGVPALRAGSGHTLACPNYFAVESLISMLDGTFTLKTPKDENQAGLKYQKAFNPKGPGYYGHDRPEKPFTLLKDYLIDKGYMKSVGKGFGKRVWMTVESFLRFTQDCEKGLKL